MSAVRSRTPQRSSDPHQQSVGTLPMQQNISQNEAVIETDLESLYSTQFMTSMRPSPARPAPQKQWRLDAAHPRHDQVSQNESHSYRAAETPNTSSGNQAASINRAASINPPAQEILVQESGDSAVVIGRIGAANRPQVARAISDQQAAYSTYDFAYGAIVNTNGAPAPPHDPQQVAFVAALEVEQFAWLPVVESLCLQQPASFDRILSELQQQQKLGHRVVGITSIRPGEGRTTIVQCLARRAAMQGLRVCIVDVDHQYPQLAEQLGLMIETGWDAMLTMPYSVNEVAIESMRDRICIVPMKQPLNDDVIIDQQGVCGAWLMELKQEFDLVLIDTAPTYEIVEQSLNDTAAATAIHPLACWPIDSWLLVRNVQETSLAELARWNRRVQSLKLNILGVLENRTGSEA